MDIDIRFYKVEYVNKPYQGYTVEISIKSVNIRMVKHIKLLNKLLAVINIFDHNGTDLILTMWNFTMEIFEHLDITSWRSVDARLSYTEKILKGIDKTKFQVILKLCK